MEALLGAIAEALPAMLVAHGPTLLWAVLASIGCVLLYLENRKLNQQVNQEIKEGVKVARSFEETFKTAFEAIRDGRRARQ